MISQDDQKNSLSIVCSISASISPRKREKALLHSPRLGVSVSRPYAADRDEQILRALVEHHAPLKDIPKQRT